jgi:hypothetical protein
MNITRAAGICVLIVAVACNGSVKQPAAAQKKAPARETVAHDTAGLVTLYHFARTPPAIRAFLDSLSGEKFLIADPGGKWNGGCNRIPDVPHRQLVWVAIGERAFYMRYLSGGFVTNSHYLTASLSNGRVMRYTLDGEVNPPSIP